MTPGWSGPQGVENLHVFCAGMLESDDWGNSLCVKCFRDIVDILCAK